MSQINNQYWIKIFFCVPNKFLKSILININTKISYLMKIFHDDNDYTYIYDGNILNSELSLKSAGISNEKLIIAIKKESKDIKNEALNWKNLSMKKDIENKLRSLPSKQAKVEYCRIQDLKITKTEGSLKLYQRLTRKLYQQNLKKEDQQINTNIYINYEPSPRPCTDAMPILW